MPRTKLEEIIESFEIKEFSQFFRLKTQADGNFRPGDERLSQYDDADFFGFAKIGQIEFSGSQRMLVAGAKVLKDLSERSGKKAQYEKAKKMLRELSAYSAGIFIYYDKSGNFRFSLIYPESVGTRREWSNFRRFTYFVSKDLTNKTFLQRVGDGNFSTLDKIKDAFSVEKVTKEFYIEYRKLFDGLMEDLSKNHTFINEASRNQINTENFAKKLLGQIVFLYFIQKKGWLGVLAGKRWGEGNKNFMGNIYKEAMSKKANFYNDYLEKLFYNALNNPHRDSADPSFSKDFGSRIPFLNGGLFEAEYDWKNSLMYLDNKVFHVIFDVFERYNFTVEEESPDDKEIAVDPEMLGKVFENLLPENLRKGKGTYYTPREIVYYMCRESLVNYLVSNHSNITEENIRNYIFYSESFENFKKQKGESFTPGQWKELDDLLASVRVCDPACGSGAFLVGMLNMIIKLRIFLQTTPDHHLIPQKKEYELKRETIQNCIYGVDIDPGAIEIAKLRLWLALVVDYDLEDIEPLPNLDYRLMCGNSLLEEFEGVKFYNGENETQATLLSIDPEKQKKVDLLKKKVKEYFSIHDDKEKLKKRKEINDIKDWLIGTALERRRRDLTAQHKSEETKANMLDEKSRKQYLSGFSKWLGSSSNIQKALESLHNPKKEKPFFIWKLEFIDVFEEKGGFDVVIANPPYVEHKKLKAISGLLKKFNTYAGTADLYVYFYEKGIDILKSKGVLTYISSNKFIKTSYGEKLRGLLSSLRIKKLIDFTKVHVFDALVASCVLIVLKDKSNNEVGVIDINDGAIISDASLDGYIEQNIRNINSKNFNSGIWQFDDDKNLHIKEKIESCSKVLGDISGIHIYRGITTGYNQAFIIDDGVKNQLVKANKKNAEIIKPLLQGRNIRKWAYRRSDKYLLQTGFDKNIKSEFPSVYSYLHNYEKELKERDDQGRNWWNLRACKYYADFEKEKIIWGLTADKWAFAYDNASHYLPSNGYILTSDKMSLKYILCLLNSRLLRFFFGFIGIMTAGGAYTLKHETINALPIKEIQEKEQRPFIDLVNKIFAITKDSDYLENSAKQARVRDYEKQIDQLVYKLYGLTPEETKIVEDFK